MSPEPTVSTTPGTVSARGWFLLASGTVVATSLIFIAAFPAVTKQLLSDDIFYHLIVARSMLETGDLLPTFDEWFMAPDPRPHVYPPLFHWALVTVAAMSGAELTTIVLALQTALFPLAASAFLLLAWSSLPPRAAFFAVLLLATTFPFPARTHLAIPEAFELILVCLGLAAYLRRREWWCGLAVLAMLLSHTASPMLFVGALIVHQLYVRHADSETLYRRLIPILAVAAPGLILQAYWAFQNFTVSHVDADKLRPTVGWVLANYLNPGLGLRPIVIPLLLSVWAIAKLRRHPPVPLCAILVVAYSVILATYSARFSSYALIPLCLSAAVAIDYVLTKRGVSRAAVAIIALVALINIPLSALSYPYLYDFISPHDQQQEEMLTQIRIGDDPGSPVCVARLFDAYRVTWYSQRPTTLTELGCGDAEMLYLREYPEPTSEWRLQRESGSHRLYRKRP